MTIGLVQPGTRRGMLVHTIGSRNTVPPRMLRIVPLGDFHIFFSLNSSTRASAVTDYEMASTSNGYTSEFKDAVGGESVVGVAGTLSVTLGNSATSAGLSYVHNDIRTTYDAELDADITATGQVSVTAQSRADIVGVSAGVGATKGKFSGMGSASVNLIGQRTQAQVTGGSVTAAGLALQSDTKGNSFALAGNLSFAVGSGNGSAAGAAVAVTQTGTRTYTSGSSTLGTRAAGNTASIDSATVNVGTGTVQLAYTAPNWNLTAAYAYSQSGGGYDGTSGLGYIPVGTPKATNPFAGLTQFDVNALALSGWWKPSNVSWVPSVSAGWGTNSYSAKKAAQIWGVEANQKGANAQSQSWYVGLQWADALIKGNTFGTAVGQPTFVTGNDGFLGTDESTFAWEIWYKFQVTDNISVTPAFFTITNPAGSGSNSAYGGVLKTSFM